MVPLLSPRQLRYGAHGGKLAAVYAAQDFITNMHPDQVIVKLDFNNPFQLSSQGSHVLRLFRTWSLRFTHFFTVYAVA